MANLNRRAARRGAARISRTLEIGRIGGDRRKHRITNNSTTQDDNNPEQFEVDTNGQVCLRLGEGLVTRRGRGVELDFGMIPSRVAGEGLTAQDGRIAISKARAVSDVSAAPTSSEFNDLLSALRDAGFLRR